MARALRNATAALAVSCQRPAINNQPPTANRQVPTASAPLGRATARVQGRRLAAHGRMSAIDAGRQLQLPTTNLDNLRPSTVY